MAERNPVRKKSVRCEEIGKETVLHDAEAGTIHALNRTARLVWDLCDGGHSPDDIEEAVRSQFTAEPEHDLPGDIRQVLSTFRELGLLEEV